MVVLDCQAVLGSELVDRSWPSLLRNRPDRGSSIPKWWTPCKTINPGALAMTLGKVEPSAYNPGRSGEGYLLRTNRLGNKFADDPWNLLSAHQPQHCDGLQVRSSEGPRDQSQNRQRTPQENREDLPSRPKPARQRTHFVTGADLSPLLEFQHLLMFTPMRKHAHLLQKNRRHQISRITGMIRGRRLVLFWM